MDGNNAKKDDQNGHLSCGIYSSPAAAHLPLQRLGWWSLNAKKIMIFKNLFVQQKFTPSSFWEFSTKKLSFAQISFNLGSPYVSEDSKKTQKIIMRIFFNTFFFLESSETHCDLVTKNIFLLQIKKKKLCWRDLVALKRQTCGGFAPPHPQRGLDP